MASNECKLSENSTENDEENRTKRNAVDTPLKSQTLPDGAKAEEFSSSNEEECNLTEGQLLINLLDCFVILLFLLLFQVAGSRIQST